MLAIYHDIGFSKGLTSRFTLDFICLFFYKGVNSHCVFVANTEEKFQFKIIRY